MHWWVNAQYNGDDELLPQTLSCGSALPVFKAQRLVASRSAIVDDDAPLSKQQTTRKSL
jgi:hypothetical protein